MMIVTGLCSVNATQELRQHALPDRPQPGARGRVVEHPHPARRPARDDALRRVPEKSRHRAQHADAAAQRAGRGGPARAPPLQRTSAARRIRADRARARFPPRPARAARLGQQALRARGRERAARRYQDRRGRGPDPGRSRHRAADQGARLRACRRSRAPERTRRRYAAVASRGGVGKPARAGDAQAARASGARHERRARPGSMLAPCDAAAVSLDRARSAHAGAAARADRTDIAADGVAERAGHAGAGGDRA